MHRWIAAVFACMLSLPIIAAPHEARIPVYEGKIRLADFSHQLLVELHCPIQSPALPGSINVRGIEGTRWVEALNHAFGDGCRITLQDDSLVLHFDREKLPENCDALRTAARVFTTYAAPEYTAAQQRQYGLLLPVKIDAGKPLVILIHGLDCNRLVWGAIEPLLERDGYQVANFSYPASQGIEDSSELLAKNIAALREEQPTLQLNLVTHSMGSLVARSYIEGSAYTGGVRHFIMLTPPNHGSNWARAEVLSKSIEHFQLWRHDPEWHWTWMITDGLGEAARDLRPKSAFLKLLNDKQRRPEVQYTIIAGDQNPFWNIGAGLVGTPATWLPKRTANWWGFRQTRHGLENAAASLRNHHSDDDGPVSLKSARLDGIDDFVVLHAEHADLLNGGATQPPLAWDIIRNRLSR